jgi:hypothetical protein
VSEYCACAHDGRGSLVSECIAHQEIREQRDALLAALKDVVKYMPSVTAFQRERLRRADAAIAKAEGKE